MIRESACQERNSDMTFFEDGDGDRIHGSPRCAADASLSADVPSGWMTTRLLAPFLAIEPSSFAARLLPRRHAIQIQIDDAALVGALVIAVASAVGSGRNNKFK
mmetsp:Transcript_5678/g.16816  ORF Transcript_5678/g.16816 Transcript_5678/m.16816 type:complete len:104 (-) Transcript_5678:3-314(-)